MQEPNHHAAGVVWDAPHYYLNGKVFSPKIFDSQKQGTAIPAGYNTLCLRLDGSVQASLDWNDAIRKAQKYIGEGFLIIWDLDLGLFAKLANPLSNQTQFLSLCLSIEHFRDHIWKLFREQSLGVCLYKGGADFAASIPWDSLQESNLQEWLKERFATQAIFLHETGIDVKSFHDCSRAILEQNDQGRHLISLYARDSAADYLQLLAARLPDGLEGFVMLETQKIAHPVLRENLVNKERFTPLHMLTNGWSLPHQETANIGICWPPLHMCRTSHFTGMAAALEHLTANRMAYRVIPEEMLITDWDGLDVLIVSPEGLSPQGKRKLQGFCAAGGTVVSLGKPIGLAQEIGWGDWVR